MNKLVIGAIIILLFGIGGIVWGVSDSSKPIVEENEEIIMDDIMGDTETESWQDEGARVMYFYSENCSWCKKQKPILEELSGEGEQYRWKPMDVGEHSDYWQEYGIDGTPTFIDSATGERKGGYQEKETLKEWMDGLEE